MKQKQLNMLVDEVSNILEELDVNLKDFRTKMEIL